MIGLAVAVFMVLYPPFRYEYDGYGEKHAGKLGYRPLVVPPTDADLAGAVYTAMHGEPTFSDDPAIAEKQREARAQKAGPLARFSTVHVDLRRLALQEIPVLILTALLFILLRRPQTKPEQPS